MHTAIRTHAVTLVVWLAIVVGGLALAGGWDGLVYGSIGMLAGYWVAWTSAQYANH
jgi:hypothetical protein